MPSFIIHSIVGRELCKKLKLSKEDSKIFFLANLLPDIKQIKDEDDLSDKEKRISIQREKRVTHFRSNDLDILEYPDLNLFLKEYEKSIDDLIVFGYFFHLYTDYYYFAKFLPTIITFLDENYKETIEKENNCFIRINKTNAVYPVDDFWSKKNLKGIYHDYSLLNRYLIRKYKFKYNYEEIKTHFDDSLFINKIKEIDITNFPELLEELDLFYKEAISSNSSLSFNIFNPIELDTLIDNINTSFVENYSYLFSKFIK